MMTVAFDTRVLNERCHNWADAIGVSQAEGIRRQAGFLKTDLWRGSPPRKLTKAKAQAMKEVGRTFRAGPLQMFDAKKRNGKGMVWLYAGKKNGRFLMGVDPADFQPGLSVNEMRRVMRESGGRHSAKEKWVELGKRGKENPFHVMKLNRIVVQASRIKQLEKVVLDKFGRQKAAWAVGIEQFGGKTPPKWVAKHIGNGARGFNLVNFRKEKSFVQVTSRATGCETKASRENIQRSINRRAQAILTDTKLYLDGTKKKAGLK